jgi:hypothetical protein
MAAASPGSVLDLVRRGAGNASITRAIARDAATTAVPAEITAWFGEEPATNVAIAEWLLRGEKYGFVSFNADFYKRQIVDISEGKDSVTIKTSRKDTGSLAVDPKGKLGMLIVLESQVRGHARRWMADPSGKKIAVQAGDLLRDLKSASVKDAHAGPSADLYQGFDWTGKRGPAQVLEALSDLPKGSYRIGLPFQGEFFPRDRYLAERQKKAKQEAGADGTPAAITEPSMIKFTNKLYTSTWDAAKKNSDGSVGGWDDHATGKTHGGIAELGSATLRQGMAALSAQGITFSAVFADNDNHLHITRD